MVCILDSLLVGLVWIMYFSLRMLGLGSIDTKRRLSHDMYVNCEILEPGLRTE